MAHLVTEETYADLHFNVLFFFIASTCCFPSGFLNRKIYAHFFLQSMSQSINTYCLGIQMQRFVPFFCAIKLHCIRNTSVSGRHVPSALSVIHHPVAGNTHLFFVSSSRWPVGWLHHHTRVGPRTPLSRDHIPHSFTSNPNMEPIKVQSEGGLNVTLTIRLLMHGKVQKTHSQFSLNCDYSCSGS